MLTDAQMTIRSLVDGKTQVLTWLLFALVATSTTLFAQSDATLQQAAGKPILQRVEGTDAESGIHYLRLLLSLPPIKRRRYPNGAAAIYRRVSGHASRPIPPSLPQSQSQDDFRGLHQIKAVHSIMVCIAIRSVALSQCRG
jgi:hypothetical protein